MTTALLLAIPVVAFWLYLKTHSVVVGRLLMLDVWLLGRSLSSPRWARALRHKPSLTVLASWWMRPFYTYAHVRTRLTPPSRLQAAFFRRYFEVEPVRQGGPGMQCVVTLRLAMLALGIKQSKEKHASAWNRTHAAEAWIDYMRASLDLQNVSGERRGLLLDFDLACKAANYFGYATLPLSQEYLDEAFYPATLG